MLRLLYTTCENDYSEPDRVIITHPKYPEFKLEVMNESLLEIVKTQRGNFFGTTIGEQSYAVHIDPWDAECALDAFKENWVEPTMDSVVDVWNDVKGRMDEKMDQFLHDSDMDPSEIFDVTNYWMDKLRELEDEINRTL